ncbi:ankyrin repeat-containing protein At2g01680-like [Magnolia sinica]|uniref:ankyrin repeat-containing protein At2g01680-like n=1 Tax=Magnolia sinica TaxID=86752 RepID=UPI00265A0369|nr:ankyrin repeat-containing protein At2g01680-like [Magnolia sinica]
MDPKLRGDRAARHHPLDEPHHLQEIIDYALVALETPLNVALLQGHVVTASEILNQNPALSHEPNRSGSYPLHVASARGYEQIVQKLLEIDPSLCLLRDKEGRTPLHLAALNGQTGVLGKLYPIHAKQKKLRKSLAGRQADEEEPILHLCVKHNQLEAAKFFLKEEEDSKNNACKKDKRLITTKDCNGNTVLHLAAAREDSQASFLSFILLFFNFLSWGLTFLFQMLGFLLGKIKVKDDLNATNNYGYTALDISKDSSNDKIINDMIKAKGGVSNKIGGKWNPFIRNSWDNWYMKEEVWANEMHNTLMVVATLIVAVTFQGAINPPGGVWQDPESSNSISPSPSPMPSSHVASLTTGTTIHDNTNNQAFRSFMHTSYSTQPGTAIHNNVNFTGFKIFMYFDMIAFAASLSIILSLVSGFPLRRQSTTWVLVFTMWAALSSMAMAFVFGTKIIIGCDNVLKKMPYILYSWLGAMVLVFLFHCIILVVRLWGEIKKPWVYLWDKLQQTRDATEGKKDKEAEGCCWP